MINFYVRQKVFSILDQYKIYDRNQNPLYQCKAKPFSLSRKLKIYRIADQSHLFTIRKKMLSFWPKFQILNPNDAVLAEVKRVWSMFKGHLMLTTPNGHLDVKGNFMHHQFTIMRESMILASVQKQWISWGDTYEISIEDQEDFEFLLCLVIVIDSIFHRKKSNVKSVNYR